MGALTSAGRGHVWLIIAVALYFLLSSSASAFQRTNYTSGILAGINGVYDDLSSATNGAPAVCVIDTRHPDTTRDSLKKPRGEGHVAFLTKLRHRIEEASGIACVVVHYTQVGPDDVAAPNFKALQIGAMDKGVGGDHRQRLLQIIRETKLPTIGFCGGHQMIAEAFGGKIAYMRKLKSGEPDPHPAYQPGQFKEWGFMPVRVLKRDPIFEGLSDNIVVREMHAWHLVKLPQEFEVLAATDECPVEAIKHKTRILYGTQFHSEQYDDTHHDGKVILRNFFTLAGIRNKTTTAAH